MVQQQSHPSLSIVVDKNDLVRFQRCAEYSGMSVSDWAVKVLTQESDRNLAFEKRVETPFEIPSWAKGLSVRTVKVLLSAGITSKTQLDFWFNGHSASDIKGYPNSGNYVYNELCMWMKV